MILGGRRKSQGGEWGVEGPGVLGSRSWRTADPLRPAEEGKARFQVPRVVWGLGSGVWGLASGCLAVNGRGDVLVFFGAVRCPTC